TAIAALRQITRERKGKGFMKIRIFEFDVARKLHRSPARNRTFSLTPRFSGVMSRPQVVETVLTVLEFGAKLLKQLGAIACSISPLKRENRTCPSANLCAIPGIAVRPVRSALCAVLALSALSHSFAATNDLASTLQRGLFEEEANHNYSAAIAAYQAVVARF